MELHAQRRTGEIAAGWKSVSLADLISHLISQHHAYLKVELPRLQQSLYAVYETYRARDGATLASLPGLLFLMKDDLDLHMRFEELVLFPAIQELERAETGKDQEGPPSGRLSNPIGAMLSEHASAAGALVDIRKITRDYRLPPHACDTYRALFRDFEALERRLQIHMYLEESVLFPRALSLECRQRN